jgi:S-(hydroxymethyl)glutathione dehydrogenase/alcohol dehydrogenase
MMNGTLTPGFPLVLGHEAAGEVVSVGPSVTRVAVGDRVVLNWSPACRECWFCTHDEPWLCAKAGAPSTPVGEGLHVTLGLGALAEEVAAEERGLIRVPPRLSYVDAALLGCAALTGTGAVSRTAAVKVGESVVVIGLGGVGLAVVLAARAAGATPIVAVDVTEAKRELAFRAGATEFRVADDNLAREVRSLTGGRGADHAFECVGRAVAIRSAWRATRRGGSVTVVGMGARDDLVSLSALDIFHSARTLRSSVYGSSDPDRDIPLLAASVLDGSLDLSPLVSHRIGLADAPAAFERMARGEGARSVVVFPDGPGVV